MHTDAGGTVIVSWDCNGASSPTDRPDTRQVHSEIENFLVRARSEAKLLDFVCGQESKLKVMMSFFGRNRTRINPSIPVGSGGVLILVREEILLGATCEVDVKST